MLVSGGVDSTVCAALLHKALREDQVIALHIDNGFMRKDESATVVQSLQNIGLKLRGEWLRLAQSSGSLHSQGLTYPIGLGQVRLLFVVCKCILAKFSPK